MDTVTTWIQEHSTLVMVILAIPWALFAARAVLLFIIRLVVERLFHYFVYQRSKIFEGEPAGEAKPLLNYIKGHRYGMSNTLGAIATKWVGESPYNQLVVAEGLGLAFSIRRFLHLGPLAREAFERMLPPTSSIGRGSFEALLRGIKQPVPRALTEKIVNGWDAFLRLESVLFHPHRGELREGARRSEPPVPRATP